MGLRIWRKISFVKKVKKPGSRITSDRHFIRSQVL